MSDPETLLPEPIFERALGFLEELTAVSSPSGDRGGLTAAAGLLAGALADRGFAPEVREEDGLPILAAGRPEAGRRDHGDRGYLLLLGHFDTVLPAAPPRREGDRLLATGAIDMKGGFAAFVGALDLLAHRGVDPAADLLLVAVPDEEVGGELSRRTTAHWGAAARAVWVLEPGELGPDGGETLVAGRWGMFDWRAAIAGRAAHSGLHYWQGRSALDAAARLAVAAQGLARRGGPTINCGRLVAGDASFVKNLAAAHGLLGTDRQLNVVPDRAVLEGEARFLTAAEGLEIAARLAALAAEVAEATGTEVDFHRGLAIPPVDPRGPQRAWCERAVTLAAHRGWRLDLEEERGGISFPNFLPDPGRVPVLDGLGPVGGGMHTREEFVDLSSLRRRIVLLADLLAADAEGGLPGL